MPKTCNGCVSQEECSEDLKALRLVEDVDCWESMCVACHDVYDPDHPDCQVCGGGPGINFKEGINA